MTIAGPNGLLNSQPLMPISGVPVVPPNGMAVPVLSDALWAQQMVGLQQQQLMQQQVVQQAAQQQAVQHIAAHQIVRIHMHISFDVDQDSLLSASSCVSKDYSPTSSSG